jgi:hypothetical protein
VNLPRFPRQNRNGAFTRVELVAASLALVLLAVISLPSLAATRGDSQRAGCFNNLRQIGLAAFQYADENNEAFPPRRFPAWPAQLRTYYPSTNILVCPADGPNPASFGFAEADAAPRSYIMNGWNDYFSARYGTPISTNPVPLSALREPSQTIVFGEKATESPHFWLDYASFDDVQELEQRRHFSSGSNGADGASQYAFADGSVRLLNYGQSLFPILLWATEPEWRTPFPAP